MIFGKTPSTIQGACFGVAAFLAAQSAAAVPTEALDRARSNIAEGNYKGALLDLKTLQGKDQEYAQTQLLLGKVYLHFKDGEQAEDALRKAKALGADSSQWRVELAHALVLQSRHPEALEVLGPEDDETLIGNPQALVVRGLAELGLGKTGRAEQRFRKALQLEPANADAGVGLIRVAIVERDLDATLKAAETVLSHSPNNLDALLILAENARKQGEIRKAADLFARIIALDPEDVRALLAHATIMMDQRSFDGAAADLDKVDKLKPNLPMSNYLRGLIAFRNKEPDKATQYIGRALSAASEEQQLTFLAGVVASTQGNLEVAKDYLGRLVQAVPGNFAALAMLAEIHLKLRESDRAIELLAPKVEDAGDARLMALLGTAYLFKGDDSSAQTWLRRAVDKAPDDVAVRTQLAQALLSVGDTDDALSELMTVVNKGPDALNAEILLVIAYLRSGKPDEALSAASQLAKRMPESQMAVNLGGLALLAKGEKEKAAEHFRKALELDPEFYTAQINLARIDIAERRLEAAEIRYKSVLEKRPGHLGAMLGMSALAELRGDEALKVQWLEGAHEANPWSLEPGIRLVQHYVARRDAAKALTASNAVAGRAPTDPQIILLQAMVRTLAGEAETAIQTYKQITQDDPAFPQTYYLMASAKWKDGDLDGARTDLKKALDLQPDYIDARLALASLELESGRISDALALAKALQKDLPDSPKGWYLEGQIYDASNKPAEAADAYLQAYTRIKSGPVAYDLAKAYYRSGNPMAAIPFIQAWLNEQPGDGDAQTLLAYAYHSAGDVSAALKQYRKVIDFDPTNATVLNNLAWIYQELGDLRALDTGKKAYELESERTDIADTYGWILIENGRAEEALPILEKAYRNAPDRPLIGYHLAVALERAGRQDEARAILRKVVEQAPNAKETKDASAMLERLGG